MAGVGGTLFSYSGARVAVLGASGFIGRWVARALCAKDADVYLFVRNAEVAQDIFSKYGIHGTVLEADLQNRNSVCGLFQKIRPSITFNLAGYGVDRSEDAEQTAYQINGNLVRMITETIAGTRVPEWSGQDIVHTGSALEYGSIGGNLSEDSIANPTTMYGKSKLAGTLSLIRYCRSYGMKGLTARLFTVYGPGEHPERLLPSLLQAARTGNPIQLTAGGQKRDFTYVEDVAEGLLRLGLTSTQSGEIVNLATGHLTSVRRFAEIAARRLDICNDKLNFGAIPTRIEEMDHSEVTVSRLRQLISWVPPTGIPEGIARTIDFEAFHPAGRG